MKFQVVSTKLLSGNAKASGRPYRMLALSGIYTDSHGEMTVGECVFMERDNAPLPTYVKAGDVYRPVIGCRAVNGKLQFEITALEPVQQGEVGKPAGVRPVAAAASA